MKRFTLSSVRVTRGGVANEAVLSPVGMGIVSALCPKADLHWVWCVFLAVELLFFYFFSVGRGAGRMEEFIERVAGGVNEYFSALTLAFIIVAFTMLLLGLVFVALVAGDILAKETEDGNLRLILALSLIKI